MLSCAKYTTIFPFTQGKSRDIIRKRGEKMRDIPFFDTQNGVAALVLKEIPYSKKAYITILSSSDLSELLKECVAFCRMVGAEQIYATGSEELQFYPVWMQLLQMRVVHPDFGNTLAAVEPVTQKSMQTWVDIYNQKMSRVDNSSHMTNLDANKMLSRGDGYFVRRDGEVVGIVMAADGKLHALASVTPGGGTQCLQAIMQTFRWDALELEVASTNSKAISLYKRLGFAEKAIVSTWHKIV